MTTETLTPSGRFLWTDEKTEKLKKLWAEGLSCSQICTRMGPGFTRNAVIGKAHRINLPARAPRGQARKWGERSYTPRKPKPQTQTPSIATLPNAKAGKTTMQEPKAPKIEPKPEPLVKPLPLTIRAEDGSESRITIITLESHMCRFPIGDPKDADFHFCGADRDADKVYCPYHCEVAYGVSSGKAFQPWTPQHKREQKAKLLARVSA